MKTNSYLFFPGNCEKAMEFYREAIGAEVLFMLRYGEGPKQEEGDGCCQPPEGMMPCSEEKIMHATLKIGESIVMMSDATQEGPNPFAGFSLSLECADEEQAKKVFAALSAGGQVQMPLSQTFFSPSFGVVVDAFGVSWMVMVAQDC